MEKKFVIFTLRKEKNMKYPRAKTGLVLLLIGVLLVVLGTLFASLLYISSSQTLAKVGKILVVVGGLVELAGLIVCGTTKSHYFRRALIVLVISVVLALVGVILTYINPTSMDAVKIITVVNLLLAIASGVLNVIMILSIIKGCGEVSSSTLVKKLASFVITLLVIAFVAEAAIALIETISYFAPVGPNILTVVKVISWVQLVAALGYGATYLVLLFSAAKTVE